MATIPKLPRTRPITIVIHETIFGPLRDLAEETSGGSVSKLVCLLIYNELLRCNKITMQDIESLG